jgi:hypothetical protein
MTEDLDRRLGKLPGPDSAGKNSGSSTLWYKPLHRTTLFLVLYSNEGKIIKLKNVFSAQNVKLFNL